MPWTFASTLIVVVAAVLGFILGAVLLSRRNSRTSQIQAAVLRQDHEWFRTTLASISDGVLASNSDGKVTFLNAVAQALTGWTQEEARGKPLTEVFQIINEENRQTIESPTVRAPARRRRHRLGESHAHRQGRNASVHRRPRRPDPGRERRRYRRGAGVP